MGEPTEGDGGRAGVAQPLLVWSLATFHSALLVVLAVGLLYAAGRLGGSLGGLDTWIGVVAYLYLWGVTWWTNRRLLSGVGDDLVHDRPLPSALLVDAMQCGALAGVLVLLPILVVVSGLVAATGGLESVPFLLVAGAVGAVLAAGVGVIVGALFSLLDLVLLRAARAWVSDVSPGPTRGGP